MSRDIYHTQRWRDLRKVAIAENIKENNGALICALCGNPILQEYDCIVHHKEEITDTNETDPEITLNLENLECVHFHCHNVIHNKVFSAKSSKEVTIVHGAPCSGKTTMVTLWAGSRDIIVDVDKLWMAIAPSRSNRLLPLILLIRDTLYDKIETRCGDWLKAWVITTEKHIGNLERLATRLDANLVHINTSRELCIKRAENNETKKKLIEEYFS